MKPNDITFILSPRLRSKRFLWMFAILCCTVVCPSSQALSEPSGACSSAQGSAHDCQFEVRSNTKAPSETESYGIKLDKGVTYSLFLSHVGTIGPRFISNDGQHNIFVPQKSEKEFKSFLDVNVPNIRKEYAVVPGVYAAAPTRCALPSSPATININVPKKDLSTNPVIVDRYSLMLDPANPGTTKTIVGSNTQEDPLLTFNFARQDCLNDAVSSGPYCTDVKYREQQMLTFSASGTKPHFNWSTPTIAAVLYVSLNGGAYTPVADCTTMYPPSINGTCGTSNGTTVVNKPTTNLCSKGNPTSVGGVGPWTWSCAGINGGTTANCQANKATPVNGSCGTSKDGWFSSAPTTGLCATGTAGSVSGAWSWPCSGQNGGSPVTCTANKPAVCTPTACKTCDYTGTHVNKTNETPCRLNGAAWSVTATDAGWCYNGHCRAYFFDDCSKSQNYVTRCFKGNVKSNRTIGTYETRSCSSCTVNTENDSCTVCRNIWGSGKTGQWDHNVNFD